MKNYFSHKEFLKFPKHPTPQDLFLLEAMKYNLNIVRAEIKTPIRITNCVRTRADYYRLKKKGYHPSATSDHFWGRAIPTIKRKDKKRYGPFFTMSAGAVDIVTPKDSYLFGTFKMIISLVREGRIDFGQVIYERSPRTEWIHIGNNRRLLFSPRLLRRVGAIKTRILKSLDGGKSYKKISVI